MKRVISVLLLVCGVLLIGLGTFSIISKNDRAEEKHEEDEFAVDKINNISDFNGIYKNNELTVKLYNFEENKVNMRITGKSDREYDEYVNLTLEENVLNGLTQDYSYHVGLKDGKLVIKNDQSDILSLEYEKTGEYTELDFVKDTGWITPPIENGITGVYKNEKHEIRLYQVAENEITCYIIDNEYSTLTKQMVKNDNGTYTIKEEQNPDKIDITIKINENSLEVTSNHAYYKTFSGTYERIGDYELNDIINDIYM